MSGGVKVAGAFILTAVLCAVLLTALEGARHRARLTQCRNNLRRLGQDVNELLAAADGSLREKVVRDWEAGTGRKIDLGRRGRGFWQALRLVLYSKKVPPAGVRYDVRWPDLFDCPVNGTGNADWDRPDSIDYRGPADDFPPPDIEDRDFTKPFAADREGNHGAGVPGYVLYLNLEVRPGVPPEVLVAAIRDDVPAWTEARSSTAD